MTLNKNILTLALIIFSGLIKAQNDLIDTSDLSFLKNITIDVIESSKIYPGQSVSSDFGPNSTGGVLIRPGGRDCYPSFWIRDYAMTLDCGLVAEKDQLHMLMLTAKTQADKAWITKNGGYIPLGAIADHIRIDDSKPVYYPGTYSFDDQGTEMWGTVPPYSDQFFFINMAYHYVNGFNKKSILNKKINGITLIERLDRAFNMIPSNLDNHIVYTTEKMRGVDFGFRDAIIITGDLALPSIFKYRAAIEMSYLYKLSGDKNKYSQYQEIANSIKKAIPTIFINKKGLLNASTGIGAQGDVWSTALAVFYGILEGDDIISASKTLADAYNEGTLTYKGNIRHILTCDDFDNNNVWERSFAGKNEYQNGSYWGTPVGWVCYTIAQTDETTASKVIKEYIDELRENDYRKGSEYGAPYECFNKAGTKQNPVYLTTVSSPLAVLQGFVPVIK